VFFYLDREKTTRHLGYEHICACAFTASVLILIFTTWSQVKLLFFITFKIKDIQQRERAAFIVNMIYFAANHF